MAILAEGRVSNVQSAILVSTGNSGRLFEKIAFGNVAGSLDSPEIVQLFVNRKLGGTRFLRQWELAFHESGDYLEPGEIFTIDRDDILEAISTNDNVVDFFITGRFGTFTF